MNRRFVTLVFAGLLAGCAGIPTEYQRNYKQSTEVRASDTLSWLEPGAEPEIFFTENLATELETRRAQGYVVIGYSQFTGPMEGDKGVKEQARESRATLVLKSALEAGKRTRYHRVFTRDDGIVYEPVIARDSEKSAPAGDERDEAASDGPEYATETLYVQTALFLARRL